MSDVRNRYQPPEAVLADANAQVGGVRSVYSPRQGMMAGLFGGPLAVIYILHGNFVAMGEEGSARQTMYLGLVLSAVLLLVLPFLPDRIPSSSFGAAYGGTAYGLIKSRQLTKEAIEASDDYRFHSNWRVLAVSLVAMLAFALIAIAWAMLASMLGWISLE